MIERIKKLESISRRLEPDRGERAPVRDAVVAYGEGFLDRLPELKAYEADKEAATEIRESPIVDEGVPVDKLLALFDEAVIVPGVNPASGRFLAYIPGGGIYYSSLGDYLAAVTNRYAGVRFAGPGAVEMENMLLDWMAGLVGYPEGSGGNLASGGSIANLTGIVTARDAHGLKARDYERVVVYLSGQVHHCIHKALGVAGLGECVQRCVPMDERYRMVPAELEHAIARDRADGLIPWLVIASAGTTDVGAIDPLQEIGRIAKAEGLWYHIDAAYGGFFALVDECRPKLAGMELSDSIVLDPHKGLFLPYGTGALLVKDVEALRRAHHYQAAYMQDILAEESLESNSPAELSPELTKHFRGLRLWLPLKLHGVGPFRACLEEKLLLTRYFYSKVQELGFEVGPEPELSVATYRWVPGDGDANEFNQALVDEIHRDGRVFISSTMLEGKFVLRLAVLTFRTHLESVDLLLDVLAEKIALLTSSG
ncbi:MAG: amino acid decarboxylase [Gemmatimonadetes bacterium]|nr:amino acid decarboxylase [Gemmatimonadota bacterium]NIO33246.1 amino acid decarboxylase [Gemmatimonadota bacterium]